MNIEHETMSGVFAKWHLKDHGLILHRFTGPDTGDCHDHPFDISIAILEGGYVERVWQRDGSSVEVERHPGDQFVTEATKIHRIERLMGDNCLTLTSYGPWVQHPGFWRWIDGKAQRRQWDGDWEGYIPDNPECPVCKGYMSALCPACCGRWTAAEASEYARVNGVKL